MKENKIYKLSILQNFFILSTLTLTNCALTLFILKSVSCNLYLFLIIYLTVVIVSVFVYGKLLILINIPVFYKSNHNIFCMFFIYLCVYIGLNFLLFKSLEFGIFNQLIFWVALGFNNILFFIILKYELIKSGIKPKKDVETENTQQKLLSIDKNLQNILGLNIYQKELIVQNIQQQLKAINVKYRNSYIMYSDLMRDTDKNTKVPACLVLAVLFIFDIFEPGMSRDELKGELSISKAEYEQGKRYKDKYYLISELSKGESKNKRYRPGRKNRNRQGSGLYYAYSLQKLIDTLIEDIRRGII